MQEVVLNFQYVEETLVCKNIEKRFHIKLFRF